MSTTTPADLRALAQPYDKNHAMANALRAAADALEAATTEINLLREENENLQARITKMEFSGW